MFKKSLALPLLTIGFVVFLPHGDAKAKHQKIDGKQIFEQHCASCHLSGGNRVNSKRPVAGSDKLQTLAQFKEYLSVPPGHMPYYQHVVGDKKTLQALYAYCKSLPKETLRQASL